MVEKRNDHNEKEIIQTSGRLSFIKEGNGLIQKDKRIIPTVICRCECGTIKEIRLYSYINGLTLSCGCLQKDACRKSNTTHGGSSSRIYIIFKGMHQRCYNKNTDSYKRYGGLGVTVCKRWFKFENFVKDNKHSYKEGLTIERIDPFKGYSPKNVTWIPRNMQSKNKRNTIWIDDNESKLCLNDYCKKYSLPLPRIYRRIKKGWSINAALNLPFYPEKNSYKSFNQNLAAIG